MAGDPLAGPSALAPGARAVLQRYLEELDQALRGSRRDRAAVLAEVADGLCAAVAGRTGRGVAPDGAAAAAVTELGPPRVVAAVLTAELATGAARRSLRALLVTGPLVGAAWVLLLVPRPWPPAAATVWQAIPVLPLVAAAAFGAGIIVLVTGPLLRCFPDPRTRAVLTATSVVMATCLTVDTVLVGLTATSSWPQAPALPAAAGVAVGASLLRLTVVAATLLRWRSVRSSVVASHDANAT